MGGLIEAEHYLVDTRRILSREYHQNWMIQ